VYADADLSHHLATSSLMSPVAARAPASAHCHIAEHHESGMMFSFNVD
jgi:FtsP/CotA-like multicopper oxidase with cupredoxin domain